MDSTTYTSQDIFWTVCDLPDCGPHDNNSSLSDITFWWTDFKTFMAERKGISNWRSAVANGSIARFLSDFLFHPDGGKNMDMFNFQKELTCGKPASKIEV